MIKAACHIKLIVPFIFIVAMAIIFVWICKLLPFWNWIYVKDITFWVLFVGIPTCFNSVANKLEDHYFRNILIDNFKFTALVEFITGTFTLVVCLITNHAQQEKTRALLEYKLDELTKRVDRHNQLIDRTYKLEGQMIECQHDIRDLKASQK